MDRVRLRMRKPARATLLTGGHQPPNAVRDALLQIRRSLPS